MKTASFFTPLGYRFGESSIELGSALVIERHPRIDFDALKNWGFLIGVELLDIEKIPFWLRYDYEYDETQAGSLDSGTQTFSYAVAALQILAPAEQPGISIVSERTDAGFTPRSVGRGEAFN